MNKAQFKEKYRLNITIIRNELGFNPRSNSYLEAYLNYMGISRGAHNSYLLISGTSPQSLREKKAIIKSQNDYINKIRKSVK